MASPIKNNSKDQTVLIIGGGVIGLCVAYYSLLAGKKVILVEKGLKDGDNCSAENAGMVVLFVSSLSFEICFLHLHMQ